MAARKSRKSQSNTPKRDTTPVNASGHWVYLRTAPEDRYATGDGLRGYAPGDPIVADNDILQEQVDQGTEAGWIKPKHQYEDESDLGYETTPSDRPPIVETTAEAVAAGNNSLAPGGGLQDGPPPRGDAPGFGFEGAITTSNIKDPMVNVTGASPADKKPPIADEPATTTPEPEDPEDLVSPEFAEENPDAVAPEGDNKKEKK